MDALRTQLPKALDVFLLHRRSDDVYEALLQAGIDAETALVFFYFVPSAFTRLALKTSGIHFNDRLQCKTDAQDFGPFSVTADPRYSFLLDAIPPLVAAWAREDILSIAARSAEYKVIDQLARDSSKLEDIHLTEMLIINPSPHFISACVPYRA